MDATAIILAAGEGTRMKSNHCKVSHKILGKPMSSGSSTLPSRPAAAASWSSSAATPTRCAPDRRRLRQQRHQGRVRRADRAPGHRSRREGRARACGITQGPVVVLNGDLPLITADTVAKFAQTVATGELACTVMTMTPPDPFGYGRIKLGADGQIERIIEQKDCTPEQAAELLECNAGCYAFDGAQLAAHINEIGNDNAQSEYYLPTCSKSSRVTARQSPSSLRRLPRRPGRQQPHPARAAYRHRARPHQRALDGRGRHVHRPRAGLDRPDAPSAATPSCGRRRT